MKYAGWLVVLASLLLLAACNGTNKEASESPQPTEGQSQEEQPYEENPNEEQSVEGTPPTVLEAATTVMRALKDGNMRTLAAWAHPDKGIRFSPYAYVDTKKDLVFSRQELKGLMDESEVREWGTMDGSGELIKLKYADYHKRFVYDADFFKDAEISLNEQLGKGNTINNLNDVYPKANHNFVEYYIEGTDPEVKGMDWRSLRLVFEKIGEDQALVGIIHDQWTI